MFRKKMMVVAFLLAMLSGCASVDVQKTSVDPGSKAPEFALPDQNGKEVRLSEVLKDYRGAVLAFYPKDFSKNCTPEFVEFQQNVVQFENRKIKVLGISRDSAESHRGFIAKHDLSGITLLTDEKGVVANFYKANHPVLPVFKRVYIIVDKQGNIVYRKDTGLALLENQTQTLTGEIDRQIK